MKQIRKMYNVIIPTSLRTWVRQHPTLSVIRDRYRANTARHDEFYDDAYYNQVAGRQEPAGRSAPLLAKDIVHQLKANSVIDVGCGTGEYMTALRAYGVTVYGVDLAEAALKRCREEGLDVAKHDLTSNTPLPWTADTVFSAEVAEHLVPEAADGFVAKLANAAQKHVVLTAAGPGQPGNNHFNCQPKQYWIDKFANQGFAFDAQTTKELEKRYAQNGAALWFQKNLMVFQRTTPV